MATYRDVALLFTQIGLLDVILPFVLTFTVVYGVLQRSKVLGNRRNVNAMVALVLGFFTVLAVRTMQFVNLFVQYAALALVAMVFVAILMAFLGVQRRQPSLKAPFVWIALIALGAAFLFALGQAGLVDRNTLSAFFVPVLGIAAFVGLLWFVLRPGKAPARPRAPEHRERQERPALPAAGPRRGRTVVPGELRPGERRELE